MINGILQLFLTLLFGVNQ